MRPLVLIRLAHALQDRRRCSFSTALYLLASRDEVDFAMRRIFEVAA
ncbi:MAG: hypothetical protein HOV80_16555 [Polyangiaceae bacterium]|nr:hypothetical protein [Polyangiaceae bacterium]